MALTSMVALFCGVEEGRKILLDTSSEMNSYSNKIPAMLKVLAEITLINQLVLISLDSLFSDTVIFD